MRSYPEPILPAIDWDIYEAQVEVGNKVISQYESTFIFYQLPYTTHVAIGDPAVLIKKIAEETSSDIIAIGHKGVSRLTGLLLGSVAFQLIDGTKIPLLIS